jgi:hypothetical protein
VGSEAGGLRGWLRRIGEAPAVAVALIASRGWAPKGEHGDPEAEAVAEGQAPPPATGTTPSVGGPPSSPPSPAGTRRTPGRAATPSTSSPVGPTPGQHPAGVRTARHRLPGRSPGGVASLPLSLGASGERARRHARGRPPPAAAPAGRGARSRSGKVADPHPRGTRSPMPLPRPPRAAFRTSRAVTSGLAAAGALLPPGVPVRGGDRLTRRVRRGGQRTLLELR